MRLRNIPGAKEAIEASLCVIQNEKENKGRWSKLFGRANPIHIEVGMGKGRFIMDMARLHPDINYIGIEMYDSVMLRALQKLEELVEIGQALPNLYLIRMDARELPLVFGNEEVDRIYLNFSDPWPKNRYAKRRLTSHQFLDRYDMILAAHGVVEFKTDNKVLFDFSLKEVKESKWKVAKHTFDLHHHDEMMQGNIMTEYEEKFAGAGNPICKMVICR